jgi:hypothetical protein
MPYITCNAFHYLVYIIYVDIQHNVFRCDETSYLGVDDVISGNDDKKMGENGE